MVLLFKIIQSIFVAVNIDNFPNIIISNGFLQKFVEVKVDNLIYIINNELEKTLAHLLIFLNSSSSKAFL